ncbi:S1 family peptidase [Providencia rettgeri]|uniref:S1 family peptidase n=1 Tax=Providencia rettgeri TaxID=587 RepID=UPI00141A55A9|nr:trypsin-like serine protease [Providencia rettgeri]EMA4781844.1 trypsin-like serine protease [Providencia rettgeri]NIH04003.1 trypsin-like serine protease [Providencia rettgeri]
MKTKKSNYYRLFIIALMFNSSALAQKANLDIINGNDAEKGEYPYFVDLNYSHSSNINEHHCGGVMLNDSWILTAAHCVDDKNTKLFAYIGRDSYYPDHYLHKANIEKVVIHEKWYSPLPNGSKGNNSSGDIALIKIDHPINNIPFIKYDTLPNQHPINIGDNVTIIGFGVDSHNQVPVNLQKKEIKILPDPACIDVPENYPVTNFEPEFSLCAGDDTGGTSGGDSGGPLLSKNAQGESITIGVVSRSLNPPAKSFTRVSKYSDWIDSVINSNE